MTSGDDAILTCLECNKTFTRAKHGRKPSRCPKCRKGAAKRAPAGGYVSMEKAAWRESVWSTFAAIVGPKLLPHAVAVVLPGKDGQEIGVAIKHGFRERNIVVVDESAALIATAKWRTRYPDLKAKYGSEVGRAFERMKQDGISVDVASLDYCSNFTTPTIESVRRVRAFGALRSPSAIAITVMRGREETATVAALRLLSEQSGRDVWPCDMRLDALFHEAGHHAHLVKHGEYRSQTQQMAWAVGAAYPMEDELRLHSTALTVSGVSSEPLRRLLVTADDLEKGLRGKPHLRLPRRILSTCKHHSWGGYGCWEFGPCYTRARLYCERKLLRIERAVRSVREKGRSHPSATLPFPPRMVGKSPGLASIGVFMTCAREWAPFDEWLVSRARFVRVPDQSCNPLHHKEAA